MKIALIHRRYTTNGGTERYLVGFTRYLVSQGHAPVVLANEVRDDLKTEPGVRFVQLHIQRPTPFLKMSSLWRSAKRALAAESWDAVMGFGRTGGHDLYRSGGGSHVAALRNEHPLRRWISPADWMEMAVDRRAVLDARICMANSQLGARGMRDDYGAKSVEVVYNGVDLERFKPDPEARRALRAERGVQGPLAIFVGNGFRRKGLDLAIAALPPDWKLWVIGSDAPWSAPPNVTFLGGQRDPERFVQAADLLVLPTRYDPFANVCLEAMACGVPILTTSTNGAAEIVPQPWMVADSSMTLRSAWVQIAIGGIHTPLGALCRTVAEGYTRERSFSAAFQLLCEASKARVA